MRDEAILETDESVELLLLTFAMLWGSIEFAPITMNYHDLCSNNILF